MSDRTKQIDAVLRTGPRDTRALMPSDGGDAWRDVRYMGKAQTLRLPPTPQERHGHPYTLALVRVPGEPGDRWIAAERLAGYPDERREDAPAVAAAGRGR